MKTKLMALAAAVAVMFGAWAAPTVTDITAKQRYPWNGIVDISCKVSGIEADAGGYEFAAVAVDKDNGKEYTVSTFSLQHNGEEVPDVCGNGDYSILWNAREDMGQIVIERMVVRITLEALAVSVGKVQLWEGGPYWADRNIGASSPEDTGLYFWSGDTTGDRPSGMTFGFNFTGSNCPAYNKSLKALLSEGYFVNNNGIYVLTPTHDAAHVKWGGAWRMPTDQELFDLHYSKCEWMLTTRDGVNGYVVRGRGVYASNSIFLPCAGYGYRTSLYNAGSYGCYWSSNPSSGGAIAYNLFFYSSDLSSRHYAYGCRFIGLSIRPVQ